MEKYGKWSPTAFDSPGAFLDDRDDWLVCPVIRTRDSGPLSESNFQVVSDKLDSLDADGADHEVHRFGHWGPGWFEIILVRPGTACAKEAKAIEASLKDYPALDDEDWSSREFEEACQAWEWTDMRDRIRILARHGLSIFAARRNDIPPGLPYYDDFYEATG